MKTVGNISGRRRIYYFSSLLCVLLTAVAHAQSWQALGADENNEASYGSVSYLSLSIANNNPYIAFRDGLHGYKMTVRTFTGGQWINVGEPGFSDGPVYYNDIAIDNTGIPYVIYCDGGNSNKATVKKFNGITWTSVGAAGFSTGEVRDTKIAIDGSGAPYVIYVDLNNNYALVIKKFDGTNWATVGPIDSLAGTNTCISINGYGIPYIAYGDINNKVTVKKYTGAFWENVGTAGFTNGAVADLSFALDGNGTPYIAYADQTNNLMASVQKFDGTGWVYVGTPGFSGSQAANTNIAFDKNNTPYVTYDLSSGTWINKFDGSAWILLAGIPSLGGSNSYSSVAIDSNNIPFVAYEDATTYKARVRKLQDGKFEIVGSVGLPGSLMSMNVSKSGFIYVAHNYTSSVVDKFDGTNWTQVGTTLTSNFVAVAVSPSGVPYCAFGYPYLNQDLVKLFNGTTWVNVGSSGFAGGDAYNIKLAISAADIPYVAYLSKGGYVNVKKFDGANWVNVGTIGTPSVYTFSFALDNKNNMLYVAYSESGYINKLTVIKFDGFNWTKVGTQTFSPASAQGFSLAIDTSGYPYIGYQDATVNNKEVIQKFDGSNWIYIGTPGISNGPVSLAINSSGTPYIAYADSVYDYKATVKKFDGQSWVTVGTPGFTARSVSLMLAIGLQDIPIIVYDNGSEVFAKSFGSIALPSHFIEFKGNLLNNEALLTWTTEQENNTKEFIIERSKDGRTYYNIGTVPSANTSGKNLYNFIDHNISLLGTSVIYYRIKEIDVNNQITYSSVVALRTNKQAGVVLVYPNPIVSEFHFSVTVDAPQPVKARIVDCTGRLVQQQQWNLSTGSTTLSMSMAGQAIGIYYLAIDSKSINKKIAILKQ